MATNTSKTVQCIYYGNDGINSSTLNLPAIIAGQDVIAGIYISIGLIGVILNGMVIYTLIKNQIAQSYTSRSLLTNLALADLFSAVAVILLGAKTLYIINFSRMAITVTNSSNNKPSFSNVTIQGLNDICKSSYVIFFTTNFISILTLTALAIDRYIAMIVHHMQMINREKANRRKTQLTIIFIWVFSICSAVPFIPTFELTSSVNNRCLFAHHYLYQSYNITLTVTLSVLFCALPALILLFCYCRIAIFLYNRAKDMKSAQQHILKSDHRSDNNQIGSLMRSREIKLTILTVTFTVIFIITTMPFIGYLIYVSGTHCNADEVLQYLIIKKAYGWIGFDEAAHFLFILPPVLNPLCYSFGNERFRKAILSKCSCKKKSTISPITSNRNQQKESSPKTESSDALHC